MDQGEQVSVSLQEQHPVAGHRHMRRFRKRIGWDVGFAFLQASHNGEL